MNNKIKIVVLTILFPAILFKPLGATVIRVIGRQLYVNGSPFTVKGVCYSPTPVGSGYSSYRWSKDPSMYKLDFPLITQMGANTIRIYRPPEDSKAMDSAYDNGLYIIMDYPVEHGSDVSNTQLRETIKDGVRDMVREWKDHPALLMWCIGNEINVHLGGAATLSDWYSLAEECAQICHEEEGENFHPVTVANCEIEKQVKGTFFVGDESDLSDDNSMKHLDIWSVQTYRGKSFANYPDTSTTLFSSYTVLSSKPLLFTEFGCDAYDVIKGEEAEDSQAEYIKSQWQEISANLSQDNQDAVCIGGCIFEWSDDWSKNQSGNPDSTHNPEATWGGDGSGGGYYDFVLGTDNMNEEWWGLTSINTSDYSKSPREAYYILKTLWGTRDVAKTDINSPFKKDPLNFPNPFRLGVGEATITFTVLAKTKVKVEIYDVLGNHIKLIEDGKSQDSYTDYELTWDGRDEWDRIVPCGLYILRIEAESPSMKKTKYRKILALK